MAVRVIVFGPTGNVGSIVARTAQENGAKVFLAMRDLQKAIPGLSRADESDGGFERVHADLTQPTGIHAAVTKTKATAAFIYLAWNTPDHMKATIESLKGAGIRFIVFLSSFTIRGDLDRIPSSSFIPFSHARVEMNLNEIYGRQNYVALRAGAFATNTLRWRTAINAGEVQLESPNSKADLITPTDMGRVGGQILVQGQTHEQSVVYLYGPHLLTQEDAIEVIINALGKGMKVIRGGEARKEGPKSDDTRQNVIVRSGPEEGRSDTVPSIYSNFREGVENVSKFGGNPATSFEEWVRGNKTRFAML